MVKKLAKTAWYKLGIWIALHDDEFFITEYRRFQAEMNQRRPTAQRQIDGIKKRAEFMSLQSAKELDPKPGRWPHSTPQGTPKSWECRDVARYPGYDQPEFICVYAKGHEGLHGDGHGVMWRYVDDNPKPSAQL